jgi:hypothetical protein
MVDGPMVDGHQPANMEPRYGFEACIPASRRVFQLDGSLDLEAATRPAGAGGAEAQPAMKDGRGRRAGDNGCGGRAGGSKQPCRGW